MDIRKAKPPLGAMPPKNVAKEPEPTPSANVDDKGDVTIEELDSFSGDLVIKGYLDYLEQNNIHQNDIFDVMDVLFTIGSVSWNFDLFDRISVVFNVRAAWVDNYITEVLDKISSESMMVSNVRYNNIVAECNLAASLSQYGEKKFSIRDEGDMVNAREFVRQLPFVVQNALVRKLAVFDRLLAVATSDWAVKNFTKPGRKNQS